MKEKKKERCGMVAWLVIGSALTVAGFIIIPSLIKGEDLGAWYA